MSKIVAAIFADRAKAYEGDLALKHLAAKGVEVHAFRDHFQRLRQQAVSAGGQFMTGFRVTAAAALIGGLAGLSGGPLGALMGAVGGAFDRGLGRALPKMVKVQSWLPGFRKNWRPGSAAVVADIAEEGVSSFEKKG